MLRRRLLAIIGVAAGGGSWTVQLTLASFCSFWGAALFFLFLSFLSPPSPRHGYRGLEAVVVESRNDSTCLAPRRWGQLRRGACGAWLLGCFSMLAERERSGLANQAVAGI